MKTHMKETKFLLSASEKWSLPVILIVLAIVFSGSTTFKSPGLQKDENLKSRKLHILEKLEQGLSISSEEIRDSFMSHDCTGPEVFGVFSNGNDFIVLPDFSQLPELPELPGFSFDCNCYFPDIDCIISETGMNSMKGDITANLEEIRKNLYLLRDSQEYLEFREEMKRFREELKDEMNRFRDEAIEAVREIHTGRIL